MMEEHMELPVVWLTTNFLQEVWKKEIFVGPSENCPGR
jgi:hypothetical protein